MLSFYYTIEFDKRYKIYRNSRIEKRRQSELQIQERHVHFRVDKEEIPFIFDYEILSDFEI